MEGQHFLLGYFKLDAIFLNPPFAIFKKKINAKAQEIIEAFLIRVLRNGTN